MSCYFFDRMVLGNHPSLLMNNLKFLCGTLYYSNYHQRSCCYSIKLVKKFRSKLSNLHVFLFNFPVSNFPSHAFPNQLFFKKSFLWISCVSIWYEGLNILRLLLDTCEFQMKSYLNLMLPWNFISLKLKHKFKFSIISNVHLLKWSLILFPYMAWNLEFTHYWSFCQFYYKIKVEATWNNCNSKFARS